MIKRKALSLCLCTVFIISSSTCYISNKTNEIYKNSTLNSIGLTKTEFPNCLVKIQLPKSEEKIIKGEDEATKDREKTIRDKEEAIKDQEKAIRDKEEATKDQEKAIRDKEEVIKDQEKAIRNEEKERKAHVCFNSYDIGIPSGITHEEMANVLNHSHYANFLKFSDAFVDAEKMYKVNAFALVAISGSESGWNKSERANNGSNNITGMDVQSDFSTGIIYNSKYDCIMDLARQLRLYYLTPGSHYYNGVSTSKVNIYYSADAKWYKTIDKIGDELIFEYDRLYRKLE